MLPAAFMGQLTAMPEPLTDRQQQILEHIREHLRRHGRSPTVPEIAVALDFHSPNGMTCHLEALARKGWIENDLAASRGIRLTMAALHAIGDAGLDLSLELRKRDVDIAALRRRLEETDKLRESLEERVRRAEGLAAAVRQTVARLESFLVLEAGRQPAKAEGLEAALSLLRGHLGPVLGDEAALAAAAVLEASLGHPGRCRSSGQSRGCQLCDTVAAYQNLERPA
jgi:LexA DNA binding domain